MHLLRILALAALSLLWAQRVYAQLSAPPAAQVECRFRRGAPLAISLTGARFNHTSWRLSLVSDSASHRGLDGVVVFYPDYERRGALLGRAYVNLDSAGGGYENIIGSFDASRHDVYVRPETAGTVITLGRMRVEHFDGAGTYLHITYDAGDTLTGFWTFQRAINGPRVAGHFCLVRNVDRR